MKPRGYKRCKTYLPNSYVLWVDDEDIRELLGYRMQNDEDAISDYNGSKIAEITLLKCFFFKDRLVAHLHFAEESPITT